jgi:hypothetical protein
MTTNTTLTLTPDDIKGMESIKERLLKAAESKKCEFPNVDKVITDVNKFYFFDEDSHDKISSISSTFLLSSFSLEYLKKLNDFVDKKYLFPQLTLDDFYDKDKVMEIKHDIKKFRNEPIIDWLIDICLEELKNINDNLVVDDAEKLLKLGRIIDLTTTELNPDRELRDIELYDALYRFQDRLNDCELQSQNRDIKFSFLEVKKSNNGDYSEFSGKIVFGKEDVPIVKQLFSMDLKKVELS